MCIFNCKEHVLVPNVATFPNKLTKCMFLACGGYNVSHIHRAYQKTVNLDLALEGLPQQF